MLLDGGVGRVGGVGGWCRMVVVAGGGVTVILVVIMAVINNLRSMLDNEHSDSQ